MNAFREISDDLRKTIVKGLQHKIIVNPNPPSETPSSISSRYTFFRNEEEYKSEYVRAYEKNEYLFAMNDGSFFQINYEFNKKSKNKVYFSKMNLCFLPNIIDDKLTHSYIRLDFDPGNNSFFHSQAHLHIGFESDIRLPVNDIILFSDFFEFIIYLFYNEALPVWNEKLKIGHTISKGLDRLSEYDILPKELENYFYLHLKSK